MPAAYSNLYIEQNSDFAASISINDVFGNLYDLQHCTANSQIRKSYYSSNATATFTTSINAANGTISLSLTSATTSNIAPGRYVYDTTIRQTSSGEVTRILEGIVDVSPSVTR